MTSDNSVESNNKDHADDSKEEVIQSSSSARCCCCCCCCCQFKSLSSSSLAGSFFYYFLIVSLLLIASSGFFFTRQLLFMNKAMIAPQTMTTTAAAAADVYYHHLPPLEELVSPNGTIVGDISWMLDFAIIAFPKAGTTFMKDHLGHHHHHRIRSSSSSSSHNDIGGDNGGEGEGEELEVETYVYERELCMKRNSDVVDFVRRYYDLHIEYKQPMMMRHHNNKTVRFGLKCPGVLYRKNDLGIYAEYFPKTKFIIGLRHPVSWFESFYNYQSYRNVSLPHDTSVLVGRCDGDGGGYGGGVVNNNNHHHRHHHQKVCTDRARFHAALARLGKTPMREGDDEISLLLGTSSRHYYGDHDDDDQQRQHNKNVYPNNSSACKDESRRRRGRGRRQLCNRHLRDDENNNDGLPNQVMVYEIRQIHDEEASEELLSDIRRYLGTGRDFPPILPYEQNKTRAIDICDGRHEHARRILVEHGADARDWMERYFLKSPHVEVASPDSFRRFISDWGVDPCSRRDTS